MQCLSQKAVRARITVGSGRKEKSTARKEDGDYEEIGLMVGRWPK